uniref:Uncharacterized protein n=1 Tax=Cacopsylla melanoneura TaxID=428564 RepID=A0A8D8XHH5_9HEMI
MYMSSISNATKYRPRRSPFWQNALSIECIMHWTYRYNLPLRNGTNKCDKLTCRMHYYITNVSEHCKYARLMYTSNSSIGTPGAINNGVSVSPILPVTNLLIQKIDLPR